MKQIEIATLNFVRLRFFENNFFLNNIFYLNKEFLFDPNIIKILSTVVYL